jgi:hypothetical protein
MAWRGMILGLCVRECKHGLDRLQCEDETEPVFCRQAVAMYIYMEVSGPRVWEIGGSWDD